MRKLLVSAALTLALVFLEMHAAPVLAAIGATPVFFVVPSLTQQTGQRTEPAMGPGLVRGMPAPAGTTIATAATETDTKAVAEETSGRARVVAADRSGATLPSLDFGPVTVGQSATRELTVRNTGTAVLSVNSITSPPPFSVVSPTDSFTVLPGGLGSVTVRFSPTTVGLQSSGLTIASNDPAAATVSIPLQGVGVTPHIEVTPTPLDFGSVAVGQSATRELTVRNTGTAELSVTSSPSTTAPFSVVPPTGPFTVAPNTEQLVTVRFSPTTVGGQSGVLSIASNDPAAATVSIPLQGRALSPGPDLVVTSLIRTGPPTLNLQGRVEVPIRVKVSNQGNTAAGIFKVATEYTRPQGTFVVAFTVPGQDNTFYPFTKTPLAAGNSVTFTGKVIFHPSVRNVTVTLRAIADSCSGEEFVPDFCRVKESDERNNTSVPLTLSLP
jgi:hypothetical protein